jgi:hypothetical protein
MSKPFVGVSLTATQFTVECVRAAFSDPDCFKLTAVHELKAFDYGTFAGWVKDLHCKKGVSPEMMGRAKAYVVNYLLCPEADSDLEVLAMMEEVWPKDREAVEAIVRGRPKISLGRVRVYW